MKPLEGCKVVELTEDRIVQEFRFGENGIIRLIGNPNPPPEEHQKTVNKVAAILIEHERRKMVKEEAG